MNPDQQNPWPWTKTFGIYLSLTLGFFLCYCLLQRFPFLPVWTVPQLPGESAIPFLPRTAAVYMSLVLLMPLAPLVLPDRRTQRRYFLVLTILGLTGLTFFALFPSRIDRPMLWPEAPIFWSWIRQCDTDGNACPSLHAAFAVYCSGAMQASRRPWRFWSWIWCIGILLSILLVKQHRIIDVLAGSLLGGLAAWIFLRKTHTESL